MNFFSNSSISKKNKYFKAINSFKNQVILKKVYYKKKNYNFFFYNKIAKSINRLNSFIEYFSFGIEKEKYLSFDFLSSFFSFRKKFKKFNLYNKIKTFKILNNNYNLIFLKRNINKLIYLKKYKRFFTFLFIDDLFYLYFLKYNSLLNFKKLIIFDFVYFYLFLKNISIENVQNYKFKKLNLLNSNIIWFNLASKNYERKYNYLSSILKLLNVYRTKDRNLSFFLRLSFLKKSKFLKKINEKKGDNIKSLIKRLNFKMPKITRYKIKAFINRFKKLKKKKIIYSVNRRKRRSFLRKKRYINKQKNLYLNRVRKLSKKLFHKKEEIKIKIKYICKNYKEFLTKKIKYKKIKIKQIGFKYINIINNEYFRINKLILKNFLENIYNLDNLMNNDLNFEEKYNNILNLYSENYIKFINYFNKFNIKLINKLSFSFLKYKNIILKKKENSFNLFFYRKKNKKKKKKKIVNLKFLEILKKKILKKNNKNFKFIKFFPNKDKGNNFISKKKIKRVYFSTFLQTIYSISKKKNKKKSFYFKKLKENNKISFNFLNLNKFYSNLDFENIFNYRLNIFSNLKESLYGLNTYLSYFPNMYFLTKFTDNFLISYNKFNNNSVFLNIIDFFLSFFNYNSSFFFNNNQKNSRFPSYYSKNINKNNWSNNKISLNFNYIYPKIYEYNYIKMNSSIEQKEAYYSNFFIHHRNFYDSRYAIDLLFQNKKESINNYLLGVYNKLLDNSIFFSSLLVEDSDFNYNSSNYIMNYIFTQGFEKKKYIKTNYENIFFSKDYIKFFFSFAKNSIKNSILRSTKITKDSENSIIKKKIEKFEHKFIKKKYTYEVFEKSELYVFFLDIFLKKYNEKENLKKILGIDIFDFNYVLKKNNKFLNKFFFLINQKNIKNKSKNLFLKVINENKYYLNKFIQLNSNKESNKSLNFKYKINLFNEYFFKNYDKNKDIFFLKIFFPKLLNYFKKRSFKFSKYKKFKTVKLFNDFYSINNLNKSILNKRRLFSIFATDIPFKVNVYPLFFSIFNKNKFKNNFFRKRSKIKYGKFYFLDLYNSYFSLTNIQLQKFVIESKLSDYFDIDIYIKKLFFAIDLINIKKKNYLSDENNYYYNSSYFSNLIYNKIYINKLKIFFKDKNFHKITKNFNKKVFIDFSTSKLNFNKSLINFNDSLFYQTNLFKFIYKIKKHNFFFNKYFFKLNKKLSINSLNYYYDLKSKNLNNNYFKLIKKEIQSKNSNYIFYNYLTKFKRIKKNTIFLKKKIKRFLGRNSQSFFLFRSFFRHIRNIYNTRKKPGKEKKKILTHLMKKDTARSLFSKIKKGAISFRYIFFYKFFFNFMNEYSIKVINKYNYFNLDYFNLIYFNKLGISNLNYSNFFFKSTSRSMFLFNFFFKKINSKFIFFNKINNYGFIFFNMNYIDKLISIDFLLNRKNYLIFVYINSLIEKKELSIKFNYLYNNKIRNKYLKDSIIYKLHLFSNNLIKNPLVNFYRINYIQSYMNNLIFKNKLLKEASLNISKNINKFFSNIYSIKNLYLFFVNFLNNVIFNAYNIDLEKLIIYKYKFNNIYKNIIKNKKNNINLVNYNVYLVKKMNEFFGKLKYISYNLIYKTHEVKNLNIYSPLDFSFNVNFFLFNYNNFFEFKNSYNNKLKSYSKNFKNIGGVLLFKIGL